MYEVHTGDVLSVLPTIPDASVDAVLTDPPYGLSDHRHADVVACLTAWLAGHPYRPNKRGFMGAGWDAWVPGPECWSDVLRILRPGGHALVFAGTRSMHLMTLALQLAGFEIRECIRDINDRDHYPGWVHGGTMPKHRTQMRGGWEPVIVARKPLDGTLDANIARHGTGGLNIEGCRIGTTRAVPASLSKCKAPNGVYGDFGGGHERELNPSIGRHPTNVVHDGSDAMLAEFAAFGERQARGGNPREKRGKAGACFSNGIASGGQRRIHNDTGTAARFYYAAKASGHDRWFFCQLCGTAHPKRDIAAHQHGRDDSDHIVLHPTVKPTSLTEYLARLVMPTAVDRPRCIVVPFAGSGSEVVGALRAGWEEVIGIEMNPEYAAITQARCADAIAAAPAQLDLIAAE